jgi:hypothetical protein
LTSDIFVRPPADATKDWIIHNNTSGYTVTFATKSGGGVVLSSAVPQMVYHAGSNMNLAALGAPASTPASSNFETAVSATISGSKLTVDMSSSVFHVVTLTTNITSVVFTGPWPGGTGAVVPVTLEITQDGTGGRTVTGWDAAVTWSHGSAPVITTSANAVDVIGGYTRDNGTTIRLDKGMENSK